MKWIKARDYAVYANIAVKNVYEKIKKGLVQSKKIKGILHVAVQDDSAQNTTDNIDQINNQYQSEIQKKLQLDNALKIQRLRNLQQDTLIKKQKQTFTKQKYRQEYVQGVFQAFTESFSNIKNLIIELKLSRQNNNKFKRIFAECIKKFEVELKKYLHEADKKEIEENEDNQN